MAKSAQGAAPVQAQRTYPRHPSRASPRGQNRLWSRAARNVYARAPLLPKNVITGLARRRFDMPNRLC
ncbi:MAG: hypothetical protein U0350_35865 [Caldilineaceae bacterium]